MNFKVLLAAGALLASQSFAIIGIGAHYAPNFGTKMTGLGADKIANRVSVSDNNEVMLWHGGYDEMMQGFGFKVWVDILPIIDIEATFNIQFGSYDASLFVVNDPLSVIAGGEIPADAYKQIDLEIELGGTPFGKANPKFVQMNGDLTITYPLTFIPIIRPYIGGGLTYYMNTFILNQPFTKRVVGDTYTTVINAVQEEAAKTAEGIANDPTQLLDPSSVALPDANAISQKVTDAMVETSRMQPSKKASRRASAATLSWVCAPSSPLSRLPPTRTSSTTSAVTSPKKSNRAAWQQKSVSALPSNKVSTFYRS